MHLNPKQRSILLPSRMGSNSKPFVAWGLFSPANSAKPKDETPVGEEDSKVSLELSLSSYYMNTATDKRKEERNCTERKSETLSSELISDVSSEHSLSKDYICACKGNRVEGGQGSSINQYNRNNCLKLKDGGVSLELNLGFDDTCITASNKRQRMENICSSDTNSTGKVSSCRNKRTKVDNIVSTELRLGRDPWCVKKQLTESDLGNMSRLLLKSECVRTHVFPFWNAEQLAKIKEGLPVLVWDCDTKSEHELVFKRWNNGAYVLINNWVKQFVNRRELKLGDAIGLYWDKCTSAFKFSVLSRVASH